MPAADLGYRPLPQIIAETLRAGILSGEYAPGARLGISNLARMFDVSPMPVREALRKLESLGLVAFEPNRGFAVRSLSHNEIRELFLVRRPLEILAATEAMRLANPEAVDELTGLVAAMDRDAEDWIALHDRFHNRIYDLSGLPFLADWLKLLRDRMRPYALIQLDDPELRDATQDDHHVYLDALLTHDAEKLRDIIPKHLSRAAVIGGYAPTEEISSDPLSSTPKA
jgi:DNA-binding GntR family transcriptional regulator